MNLLIADDHALFRDTLDQYIQRAQPLYTTRTASSLDEVVEILNAGQFRPDLCLLDFRMPGVRGHDSFSELREAFPNIPFAVMSGVADEEDIEKILATGVAGYIPKTLSGRALLKAVDIMLDGERFIPYQENSSRLMVSAFAGAGMAQAALHQTASDIRLTGREKDVLKLLARGRANKEIAAVLDLQTVTVKLHMRGIFTKLNCANRTQAAIKAKELGILD